MTRSQIVTELRRHVDTLPAKIASIPSEKLLYKPSPVKWSKQEILGHLVDSALQNWQRFAKAQLEPQPFVFQPYDQDNLVIINGYQNQSIGQILSLWVALNKQIVHVMEHTPEAQLGYKTIHARSRQENTLLWLMEDYVSHLQHHLQQIFEHP